MIKCEGKVVNTFISLFMLRNGRRGGEVTKFVKVRYLEWRRIQNQ